MQRVVFFIAVSFCLVVELKAQLHVYAGAGATNGLPGAELCVGYRHGKGAIGAGFTAADDAAMPLQLHIRAQLVTQYGIIAGAGPVWQVYSTHATQRNSLQAQLYAAYHFCYYKRSSFYISTTYTTGSTISAHVGMSLGLWKE
jgi:hypothetical protein